MGKDAKEDLTQLKIVQVIMQLVLEPQSVPDVTVKTKAKSLLHLVPDYKLATLCSLPTKGIVTVLPITSFHFSGQCAQKITTRKQTKVL